MTTEIKASFKNAIIPNDLLRVEELLLQFSELAKTDLRPDKEQNHFTNGFPLVEASKLGNIDMAKLLLENGADPNAQGIEIDDPPEFGVPICNAVELKNYQLAHLLLDYEASVNAFPYCDRPMIEKLYNQARIAGVDPYTLRKGFTNYLGDVNLVKPTTDSPDAIKLYYRILELGVEPSISTVVRDEYLELLEDLLRTCPEKPVTKLSYPLGSFFENIVYCASWFGYPEIMKMSIDICPELFTKEIAKQSIYRAIISHNRDGSTEDYISLIKTQIEFLKSKEQLEWIKKIAPLYPFYELANHFLNKETYSCKAPLTTSEDLITIAQLFINYGFDDYHIKHPIENLTPIEKAKTRIQDYQGMSDYISFLEEL